MWSSSVMFTKSTSSWSYSNWKNSQQRKEEKFSSKRKKRKFRKENQPYSSWKWCKVRGRKRSLSRKTTSKCLQWRTIVVNPMWQRSRINLSWSLRTWATTTWSLCARRNAREGTNTRDYKRLNNTWSRMDLSMLAKNSSQCGNSF